MSASYLPALLEISSSEDLLTELGCTMSYLGGYKLTNKGCGNTGGVPTPDVTEYHLWGPDVPSTTNLPSLTGPAYFYRLSTGVLYLGLCASPGAAITSWNAQA